jgi:ribosomal protein L11 methyltransferase
MAWLQLIIPTNETEADQLSDALMEQGAVSVTLQDMQDQPVLEPAPGSTPMWSQTRVVGLFDANEDLKQVIIKVEKQLRKKIPDWKAEQLEDKDWVRAWMDDFKPMQFGEKLWVAPLRHRILTQQTYCLIPDWPLAPAHTRQPQCAWNGLMPTHQQIKTLSILVVAQVF